MKAIIMAGGMGTRLRCVTGDSPKPLVPLLGAPLMEHIIRLLAENGFTELCAAVKYRAEDIMSAFGDGQALGVSLCYRVEDEPLGTAGAVKNCRDFIGDEDFLVISADAACDFELNKLMEMHKKSGAAATIALCRRSEPLRYGLAVTDGEGFVRSFIEKPDWPRVVTDLVNTGIYVLSPQSLALVPEGQAFDFGKDLFPLLLSRGEKIYGVAMDGYWCDVGTPLSYYRCCADALEGRLRIKVPESFRIRPPEGGEIGDDGGESMEIVCADRAWLMGALGAALMDMGADYSDGLRLDRERFRLHFFPLAERSALRVSVRSEDAEFARSLCLSAKELAEAIERER